MEARLAQALVTGGAGFIGRHLVAQLQARGDRVRVLDPAAARAGFGADVDIRAGSVLDAGALSAALNDVDHVYHLAANAQLWAPDPTEFDRINRGGTEALLASARGRPIKRIVVTSSEVTVKAWRDRSPGPTAEPATPLPRDAMAGPYSRSKHAADALALAAAADGLPVTLVHPTLPIGPGDVGLTPPTTMILGFLREAIPAYLDTTFNLIAVEDVAVGHILAAARGETGARYILGHENLTMTALLALLEEIAAIRTPRRRVPYALAWLAGRVETALADHVTRRPPTAPFEGVRLARAAMAFDPSKAVRDLGLPQSPVRDALTRAVGWLIDQGHAPNVRLREGAASA
ncbi:MAG: NAD-dependent epimerase/dehydratase family protein [Pseudomonadota bacterium]